MSSPLPVPKDARRQRLRPLLGAVSYVKRGRATCFVCATVAGDEDYRHHVVFEDEHAIAFLVRWPMLWGHLLVAPKQHREHVVDDFSSEEFLRLQTVVHRVGQAVTRAVPCDRLYVLSLGSQQLNRHVHWHIAPLPPGVPLRRQQFRAFSKVIAGELACSEESLRSLTLRIQQELEALC